MSNEQEEEIMHEIDVNDLELDMDQEQYQYKEAPIPLIEFVGQTFKLNEEAINMLKSIEDDVIVVSVVGKARTGKSYLMNLLLDNIGKNGFDVGSTINSCTKGIWLWGNFRKKQGGGEKIIFIDSEGTSSVDRSTKTYDSKIFALVVLISSLFLYNTTANIDEHGISELSLAAHLSTSIACNSSVDKESLISDLAPKFIWVLRDFTLEKVHPESGEEISSNEYLEVCLRKKVSGKNSAENNLIRENILKYFKERECFTLPRPVESEEELRNLKEIKFEKLKPSFKIEFMALKNKVYKDSRPKKIKKKNLTGISLANLITEFVSAINNGAVPNINNAWDNVIAEDIKLYYEKAVHNYRENIKSLSSNNQLTYPTSELVKTLLNIGFDSWHIFNKLHTINPEISDSHSNNNYHQLYEEHKNKLENEIIKSEEKTLTADKEKKRKSNMELLKSGYKEIVNKFFNNYYNLSKNNFDELSNDLVNIFQIYLLKSDGPDQLKIFTNFLNDNLKEILYYIVTNSKTENKIQINEFDKNSKINLDMTKELESTGKKLKEINEIMLNRIQHLETDNSRKQKEIQFLKERYDNLLKERKILNLMRKESEDGIVQSEANRQRKHEEVRFDSNLNFPGGKNCECQCSIY